ncbi:MAG TPA: cell division protein FtsZ [Polyangia bacterium]|nr:cell division protein FtsZ [Polyangia bacterium]
MLEFDDEAQGPGRPVIKVIGVGGGGGNALNTMIEAGVEGVDFIVANTDGQVLEASLAGIKVHLGRNLTKGLGAGANPEIGRAAALEDASRVAEALTGADMVFVTAGMGGGTGTGAAPVIAQIARDVGALTVGVVTKPFLFEGSQRKKKAAAGIAELSKAVDALIVIPNDRLVSLAGMKMTLKDAFAMVDNVCVNAVRGISDLVIAPGLINVDFADVRTIMTGMGRALMGTGIGHGDKRAVEAAQQAISSPLLEDVSINGATGILLNITGGPDLTLAEMNEACSLIAEAADPDANIIFGSVIDAHAGDQVRITVIATGFQSHVQDHPAPSVGRPAARGRDGQMALPMQQTVAVQAPVSSAQPTAPYPIATAQTPRGGYMAPAPRVEAGEAVNVDDFYLNMEQVPPSAAVAAPSGSEWTPPERPIIRPQASAPGSAPLVRRASAQVPAQRPADELGVEESEFDKPTYLRRGLYAPE